MCTPSELPGHAALGAALDSRGWRVGASSGWRGPPRREAMRRVQVADRLVDGVVDREEQVVPDQLEQLSHRGIGADDREPPAALAPELLAGVKKNAKTGRVDEGDVGEVDHEPRVALAYQAFERLLEGARAGDVDLPGEANERYAPVETADFRLEVRGGRLFRVVGLPVRWPARSLPGPRPH